ncbi:hypothetical protein Avbf_01258 [Armadillidium vulgare]|nr:hypothetical protein Avbf_01258 [Armadillidium vulgare]
MNERVPSAVKNMDESDLSDILLDPTEKYRTAIRNMMMEILPQPYTLQDELNVLIQIREILDDEIQRVKQEIQRKNKFFKLHFNHKSKY